MLILCKQNASDDARNLNAGRSSIESIKLFISANQMQHCIWHCFGVHKQLLFLVRKSNTFFPIIYEEKTVPSIFLGTIWLQSSFLLRTSHYKILALVW